MYVKVDGGVATRYTFSQLRADNPNTSFSTNPSAESLANYNVYEATTVAAPTIDPATTKLDGYSFTGSGTTWTQVWATASLTAEEQAEYAAATARQEDIALLKADAEVLQLLKARPNQINNYIDNNVTDLASAKDVLKRYGRALAVLAQTVVN